MVTAEPEELLEEVELEAPEELGTAASVMIEPPFPILTFATGEVVVTAEPAALVVVMTTPGKSDDVVIVEPAELVVTKVASTLTDADATKADVV